MNDSYREMAVEALRDPWGHDVSGNVEDAVVAALSRLAAEKDAEMTKLNDQWAETRDDLARQNTVLRFKLAEKDAEYAGVVDAAKIRLADGHNAYCQSRLAHHLFCDCGHAELEKALVSLPAPTSQVMPGEITCANVESKPQEKI